MAVLIHGINGPVSGRVGNLVYCKWRGINYVRSRPRVSIDRKPSAAQVHARRRFAFMQDVLNSMVPLVRIGFMHYAENQSGHNAAMSYNMKNALVVKDGDFALDYEKFAFAKGQENPATDVRIDELDDHFMVRWDYNREIQRRYNQAGYRVTILFYPEDTKRGKSFGEILGNKLQDGHQNIVFKTENRQVSFHVYMAFHSVIGDNISTDSIYVGRIPAKSNSDEDAGVQADKKTSSSTAFTEKSLQGQADEIQLAPVIEKNSVETDEPSSKAAERKKLKSELKAIKKQLKEKKAKLDELKIEKLTAYKSSQKERAKLNATSQPIRSENADRVVEKTIAVNHTIRTSLLKDMSSHFYRIKFRPLQPMDGLNYPAPVELEKENVFRGLASLCHTESPFHSKTIPLYAPPD